MRCASSQRVFRVRNWICRLSGIKGALSGDRLDFCRVRDSARHMSPKCEVLNTAVLAILLVNMLYRFLCAKQRRILAAASSPIWLSSSRPVSRRRHQVWVVFGSAAAVGAVAEGVPRQRDVEMLVHLRRKPTTILWRADARPSVLCGQQQFRRMQRQDQMIELLWQHQIVHPCFNRAAAAQLPQSAHSIDVWAAEAFQCECIALQRRNRGQHCGRNARNLTA